jgi:hypothetical protein
MKGKQQMAPTDTSPHEDQAFLDAFGEDKPQADSADEDFGAAMGAEPVVVIDAQVAPDARAAEEQGNAEAIANARAVNEADNAAASTDAKPGSTGAEEAAAQSGAAADVETPATEAAEAKLADASVTPEATPEQPSDLDDMSDVPPEDTQKAKSWMGRLKKIEADLKARQAQLDAGGATADAGDGGGQDSAASDALEQVSEKADETGQDGLAQAASEAADQVESGQLSPEQAMAQLAEDFGQPFVDMIAAVTRMFAGSSVKDAIAPLAQNHEQLVSALTDKFANDHQESISGAHPDYTDVAGSPDFKAFVANYPNGQQIVDGGSAQKINAMIQAFKDSQQRATTPPAPSGPSEQDVDAATGVRSKGLRIPEQPARSDDYEQAWKEF